MYNELHSLIDMQPKSSKKLKHKRKEKNMNE